MLLHDSETLLLTPSSVTYSIRTVKVRKAFCDIIASSSSSFLLIRNKTNEETPPGFNIHYW